jgi:transcriptional regulator NrdR family protein
MGQDNGKVLSVIKRDGTTVQFEQSKISQAIFKAAKSVGGKDTAVAEHVAYHIYNILLQRHLNTNTAPHVEEIQDLVEKTLIELGHAKKPKPTYYIGIKGERSGKPKAFSWIL